MKNNLPIEPTSPSLRVKNQDNPRDKLQAKSSFLEDKMTLT